VARFTSVGFVPWEVVGLVTTGNEDEEPEECWSMGCGETETGRITGVGSFG